MISEGRSYRGIDKYKIVREGGIDMGWKGGGRGMSVCGEHSNITGK